MELVCIGSTQVTFMQGNGLMDSVMVVEFILVRMGVCMLESLSGVLSMALVITISGKLHVQHFYFNVYSLI